MKTLVSKHEHFKKLKVILPYVGEVEFDENGYLNVDDDDTAHNLVHRGIGLSYKENLEDSKTETKIVEIEKPFVYTKTALSKLSKEELQSITETAQFPKQEWENLNKVDLVNYILAEINKDDQSIEEDPIKTE